MNYINSIEDITSDNIKNLLKDKNEFERQRISSEITTEIINMIQTIDNAEQLNNLKNSNVLDLLSRSNTELEPKFKEKIKNVIKARLQMIEDKKNAIDIEVNPVMEQTERKIKLTEQEKVYLKSLLFNDNRGQSAADFIRKLESGNIAEIERIIENKQKYQHGTNQSDVEKAISEINKIIDRNNKENELASQNSNSDLIEIAKQMNMDAVEQSNGIGPNVTPNPTGAPSANNSVNNSEKDGLREIEKIEKLIAQMENKTTDSLIIELKAKLTKEYQNLKDEERKNPTVKKEERDKRLKEIEENINILNSESLTDEKLRDLLNQNNIEFKNSEELNNELDNLKKERDNELSKDKTELEQIEQNINQKNQELDAAKKELNEMISSKEGLSNNEKIELDKLTEEKRKKENELFQQQKPIILMQLKSQLIKLSNDPVALSIINAIDNNNLSDKQIKELCENYGVTINYGNDKTLEEINNKISILENKKNNSKKYTINEISAKQREILEKIQELEKLNNDRQIKDNEIKNKETKYNKKITELEKKLSELGKNEKYTKEELEEIRDAYRKIESDISNELQKWINSDDFDNVNNQEKELSDLIKNGIKGHKDYEKLNKWENKDKLEKELAEDIRKKLDLEKEKDKTKNKGKKEKTWLKSAAAFGVGFGLGFATSFVLTPPVAIGVTIGVRLAIPATEKICNKIVSKVDPEKHPKIHNGAKKITEFLSKPTVKKYINLATAGFGVGYGIGKATQALGLFENNSPSLNPTDSSNQFSETPGLDKTGEKIGESISDQIEQATEMVNDKIPERVSLGIGNHIDASGIMGYVDSYGNGKTTIIKELAQNAEIVGKNNGMVLLQSADGDPLGWFKAEDLKKGAKVIEGITKTVRKL